MKKLLIIAVVLFGCTKTKSINTTDMEIPFIENHSEIHRIDEDKREFKLSLLRIDRDYYLQCNNTCFTAASNILAMGNLKEGKKWYHEMLNYQRLYKKVADSIHIYHQLIIDPDE